MITNKVILPSAVLCWPCCSLKLYRLYLEHKKVLTALSQLKCSCMPRRLGILRMIQTNSTLSPRCGWLLFKLKFSTKGLASWDVLEVFDLFFGRKMLWKRSPLESSWNLLVQQSQYVGNRRDHWLIYFSHLCTLSLG